jgi:acetyltransferase-like isoleucine patch superfamily enzyme
MEIRSLYARVVFKLRARGHEYLGARPRTLYWRALGLHAGAGTLLPRIQVTWPHQVSLGRRCILEPGTLFKFDGVYKPGPSIRIADDVFVGTGCEFNIRRGISVGSNGLIASGCRFIDHDHGFSRRDSPMSSQADGSESEIVIGEDVWLGANVVVLKGVTIGRGAIVAAGSVLTRPVGAYEIWGGTPARKLKDRPDPRPARET